MNFRQMRYFVTIVEEGSFSRAARTLRVAQPSLSQHMVNLEEEIGAQLLVRSPRGVTPTAAGDVLYLHAKKISAQFKQARDDVRLEADTPKGEVAVVLPPMLTEHLPARLLGDIEEAYPEVRLRIMEARSLEAHTLVETGRVDIGLLGSVSPLKNVNSAAMFREPLFFVQGNGSGGGEVGEPITFDEVAELPLVLSRNPHAVRRVMEKTAAQKKISLNVKVEAESTGLLKNYLKSGIASAILPWPYLCSMLKRGEVSVRKIVEPELIRTIYIAWSKNYPLNAAATIVKEKLSELIGDLHEEEVICGEMIGR